MTKPQMTSPQYDAIIRSERRLMAPCCYTQTIDLHESEIAQTMRQEVAAMVLAGKKNIDIWEHYKAIYGEQILAVPDGVLGTAAFAIPTTGTAVAASALLFFLYRLHRRKVAIANLTLPSSGAASMRLSGRPLSEEESEIRKRIRAETA